MDRRDYMAMTGGNKKPVVEDENGVEHELPVRFEVCGTCQGRGSHVNPSIDSHGLTSEDFAEDPGFYEDYMSGRYDQTCNECHGLRVVEVVDRDMCDAGLLAAYDAEMKADAEFAAECAAERRMGC
jgi:hypothetical protein